VVKAFTNAPDREGRSDPGLQALGHRSSSFHFAADHHYHQHSRGASALQNRCILSVWGSIGWIGDVQASNCLAACRLCLFAFGSVSLEVSVLSFKLI